MTRKGLRRKGRPPERPRDEREKQKADRGAEAKKDAASGAMHQRQRLVFRINSVFFYSSSGLAAGILRAGLPPRKVLRASRMVFRDPVRLSSV